MEGVGVFIWHYFLTFDLRHDMKKLAPRLRHPRGQWGRCFYPKCLCILNVDRDFAPLDFLAQLSFFTLRDNTVVLVDRFTTATLFTNDMLDARFIRLALLLFLSQSFFFTSNPGLKLFRQTLSGTMFVGARSGTPSLTLELHPPYTSRRVIEQFQGMFLT